VEVKTTNKGHVIEHVLPFADGAMSGVQVVLLEMLELKERRYRLRTPEGAEARVTCAQERHVQETRNHRTRGIYQVDKGWIACVTGTPDNYSVEVAFANDDDFVLSVPKNTDYVIVLSGPVTYTYMTNDKVASKPKKDALYEKVLTLTDLDLFAGHIRARRILMVDMLEKAQRSFKPYGAET